MFWPNVCWLNSRSLRLAHAREFARPASGVSANLEKSPARVCLFDHLGQTSFVLKVNFMSTISLSSTRLTTSDLRSPVSDTTSPEDVVEIGLLLPAKWATALIDLSTKRQESVGHLIRACIGRALVEYDTSV